MCGQMLIMRANGGQVRMLLVTWIADSQALGLQQAGLKHSYIIAFVHQVKMAMLQIQTFSADYCVPVSGLLTLLCYFNDGSLINKTLFIILSRVMDEGRTVDIT